MKRMIVAPHCDDEVLGCGGLLAKYPDECVVVFVTNPSEVRLQEAKNAAECLGYGRAEMLQLPDGEVEFHGKQLVGDLDRLLGVYKPDELYLPYPDLHQDHIATYEAGMRSARASMKADHWYVANVLVYDVAAYSLELAPTGLKFNVFEDVTEVVHKKGEAMDLYASECAPPPAPSNGQALIVQAQALGSMHKLGAVEQYAAVRTIR
jgi:LmbE family N-acetylglucosaminyl deacetylase